MSDTSFMLKEVSVIEQRYQAVSAVIRDGVPVVEVARRFDVSRQAVHRWVRWYEDEGVQGLKDRSHAPPRCAHQTPAEVEVWLVEARRRHPLWGSRRLAYEAARAGVEPVPSKSAVYRLLKPQGLIDPEAKKSRDRKLRRWERGAAMELWQMDVVNLDTSGRAICLALLVGVALDVPFQLFRDPAMLFKAT